VRVFRQFQGVALVKTSGMRKGKAILKLPAFELELKAEAVKAFNESAENVGLHFLQVTGDVETVNQQVIPTVERLREIYF
jgi:hypothetical protein